MDQTNMQFPAIWETIVSAAPGMGIAAVFAIMWFLERGRANDERKINEDRTGKFWELYNSVTLTLSQHSNTMDKALELLRQRAWERDQK